jgi:hypothetical protein
VNTHALLEFLIHGVKYAFAASRGPVQRGMPTAHSAAPLRDLLTETGLPLVWADATGEIRGETLSPIYKTAPEAAKLDSQLYQALALLDAIRFGRARERTLAAEHLTELLEHAEASSKSPSNV